jgi:hypothetical protein
LPDSLDLTTFDAYRKWYHNYWFSDIDWNPALEANLQASTQINPWRLSNMKRIRAELKNITIKEMPMGSHTSLIFLSRDSIIECIDSFLLK